LELPQIYPKITFFFNQVYTFAMSIRVVSFTGNKAQQYLPQLAQLRMTVFSEFPYLYEGAMDYETQYLQTYTQTPDAVVVVAFDGEAVVGVSTALPMLHESDNVKQPFIQADYPITRLFYYGESVLLPNYRGRGIGKAFFAHREKHALHWGAEMVCFCAVIRPDDHPLKPADYKPLHGLWQKQGFSQQPHLTCQMTWKDIDQPHETDKTLVFWIKKCCYKQKTPLKLG